MYSDLYNAFWNCIGSELESDGEMEEFDGTEKDGKESTVEAEKPVNPYEHIEDISQVIFCHKNLILRCIECYHNKISKSLLFDTNALFIEHEHAIDQPQFQNFNFAHIHIPLNQIVINQFLFLFSFWLRNWNKIHFR